eukprot:scaffold127077_cov18-Tisochrysis_lutea.AAC.2
MAGCPATGAGAGAATWHQQLGVPRTQVCVCVCVCVHARARTCIPSHQQKGVCVHVPALSGLWLAILLLSIIQTSFT